MQHDWYFNISTAPVTFIAFKNVQPSNILACCQDTYKKKGVDCLMENELSTLPLEMKLEIQYLGFHRHIVCITDEFVTAIRC